ncbi:hypothetical protein [Chitinophaga qingshengii]|uniref:DUF302 domain-containing protein n=1 Tax=Chitinophaga qingshengii TaxID=1569794 RepID=A0ABR7TRA0_9BACT|nr:hypothetical protein [Chitinophaga qingshengii]MBC9933008.1 hypothetical protein [Chitinophaga qingshengii]
MKKALLFLSGMFVFSTTTLGQGLEPKPSPADTKLSKFIYQQLDSTLLADTLSHAFSIKGLLSGNRISQVKCSNGVPQQLRAKLERLPHQDIDWSQLFGKTVSGTTVIIPVLVVKDGRSVMYVKYFDDLFDDIFSFEDENAVGSMRHFKNTIMLNPLVMKKYIGGRLP